MFEAELVRAASCGNIAEVQFYIKKGADPRCNKNAALLLAAEHGHWEVLKFLCALPGVDPSADDNALIRKIAKDVVGHDYPSMVRFLFKEPRIRSKFVINKLNDTYLSVILCVRELQTLYSISSRRATGQGLKTTAINGDVAKEIISYLYHGASPAYLETMHYFLRASVAKKPDAQQTEQQRTARIKLC